MRGCWVLSGVKASVFWHRCDTLMLGKLSYEQYFEALASLRYQVKLHISLKEMYKVKLMHSDKTELIGEDQDHYSQKDELQFGEHG
jgi:hypothetical protein